MHKRVQWGLFLALFLAVFLVGTPLAGASGAGTFEEILNYVQEMHISNPQKEILYDGAINGLVDTLDDPYTVYMNPDEFEDFSNSMQGTFVGVGIELVPGESYPSVLRTIEGSPAEKAGIKAGDIIIKVDGTDIFKESLPMIVREIRGPDGTMVRLTVRREGREDFDLEVLRSSINLPTVRSELLEDGIGYIEINNFGSSTAGDFKDALTTLKTDGTDKLILDLRNNPGGYLHTAVQIAGNFLARDELVVSTVDHDNKREAYRTQSEPICKDMPVAILVNTGSASASEILAGALQDYGVAALIGDRTFGKGTVQTVIPLKAGGALKLTTAKYHTPNDRVIDHMGLEPDIQVLSPGLQLEAAKSLLNPPAETKVTIAADGTEAIVNGREVKLSQAPLQQGDTIYLPLRFVFEALGYRVDWQSSDDSIKVTDTQSEVLFYPGEDGQTLSGGQVMMGTEPLLNKMEVTYVPLSSLTFLNLKVQVDNDRITIEK
ncbi:MAG: S41 family peptidase [Desulfotomaculaceae bacterium]|nr:S41 family peptidase [Desulfotomaculaceae bacterium]